MPQIEDEVRLRHILDAARKAVHLTTARTRDDLDSDDTLALAVVRLLEIIGEAARSLSEEVRQQAPDVPWRQIAGTRDRLIHRYFEVDLDVVWTIVRDDLPPLIARVEAMLSGGDNVTDRLP